MQFTPLDENELTKFDLLEPGIYPFTIIDATETHSKTDGSPMIKIKLQIEKDNLSYQIFDYLLEKVMWKIFKFCKSVDISEKYRSGDLSPEELLKRKGFVKINIEKSQKYGDRNKVQDYVVPLDAEKAPFNDEIPF